MEVTKSQKKIALVLTIMVVVPSLIYMALEFTRYSETEELLNEVYKQQLDVILFSVNQHAWDKINLLISELEEIISDDWDPLNDKNRNQGQTKLELFINSQNIFKQIIFYDTTYIEYAKVYSNTSLDMKFKPRQTEFISNNKPVLKQLLKLKSKNYRKVEPFSFDKDTSNSQYIGLVYVSKINQKPYFTMLVMDADIFINKTIINKLDEIAGENLICAVFNEKTKEPIISTQSLTYHEASVRKKLWIFPNYTLGIAFKGFSLEEIANNRMIKSISLILIVNLILLFGVWFLYKNTKREMHLAQLKSDFVSNVSHELRTPLSIIRMFAESLEMGRVSGEKKKEYYKNISDEAERLTHLVNNILNFSKIESGKKEYTFQNIALNDLVKKVTETYSGLIEEKGFTLKLELAKQEIFIDADIGAVSENIINLLDNAMKYSSINKEIFISTTNDQEIARLSVKDSGMGILPENQKKIFEKFYRESNPLIHDTKGSGLGLTIVKHNMSAHNGTVKLVSIPGKGSTFTLCFPNKRSDHV